MHFRLPEPSSSLHWRFECRQTNVAAAQQALYHPARCNQAARVEYSQEMETK